ncbi:hypothetical protein U9M73_21645 [Paenibacillus phoenicis]|uniref:Uncharacterized protein n=1 Tax=Paenibacillus phoenicis TaxID=554117 RepID=A0ABU5PRJ8_9BACL|nr:MULTISPECIES: hypothetical protein [Paenibacillus]MEA3572535.1 hypothetical protein [Paenibacillus phoenicis]
MKNLDVLIGGNDVESLIATNQRLTAEQVREIRRSGTWPSGYRLI